MTRKPTQAQKERVYKAAMRGFDAWRKGAGVTLEEALAWKGNTPQRTALIRACAAAKRGSK